MSEYPDQAERLGRLVRATLAKTEVPEYLTPPELARMVAAFATFQSQMVNDLQIPVSSEFDQLWWELETINGLAQADGRDDLNPQDEEDARRMAARMRQLVASGERLEEVSMPEE